MTLENIRNFFYEHCNNEGNKDFVIRLRENNKQVEDYIYYNGIKIFIIKNNTIELSPNIFMLSDAFLTANESLLKKENERFRIFEALANLRIKLFDIGFLICNDKMHIKYKESNSDTYKSRKKDVLNNKVRILNEIEMGLRNLNKYVNLKDTYLNRKNKVIKYCTIDNYLKIMEKDSNKLKISKMIDLINIEYFVMDRFINFSSPVWSNSIKRIENKSGWQKPECCILKAKSVLFDEFDVNYLTKVVDILKEAVDSYLKVVFEVEKYYQHLFMLNELIPIKFKKLGVDVYRFEEEYYTIEKGDKGRIDTVFVSTDGKDVYLIELKVNRNVVGGTNGIHKHFIDIENLYIKYYSKNKLLLEQFISTLNKWLKYRREKLDNCVFELSNEPNIHFWTVIAYDSEDEKKYIEEEMLDKYKTDEGIKGIKNAISKKEEYKERVLTIDKHINNLEKYGCEVRIYFDEICFDRENKKMTLTSKDFEPYYIKN